MADIEIFKGYQRSLIQSTSDRGNLWMTMNITIYQGNFSFMVDTEHLDDLIITMKHDGLEVKNT